MSNSGWGAKTAIGLALLTLLVLVLFGAALAAIDLPSLDSNFIETHAREREDTQAQIWMAWAAWAQVLVGLLGLIGVAATVFFAAAAWREARAAAAAAAAQASIAQQSLAAERRPWIAIDGIDLRECFYEEANGNLVFKVAIRYRNAGNSPAQGVRISSRITADESLTESHRLQKELRASLKAALREREPLSSDTIFPGAATVERERIETLGRQDRLSLMQTWDRTFTGGEPWDFVPLRPTIYGLVSYRSQYDDEIHTTGFMISFFHADAGSSRQFAMDRNGDVHPFKDPYGSTIYGGWFAD